jgi:hypothetical protein
MRRTGHIRQRSPGSWELRHSPGTDAPTGKRRILTTTVRGDRKAAERELRRLNMGALAVTRATTSALKALKLVLFDPQGQPVDLATRLGELREPRPDEHPTTEESAKREGKGT